MSCAVFKAEKAGDAKFEAYAKKAALDERIDSMEQKLNADSLMSQFKQEVRIRWAGHCWMDAPFGRTQGALKAGMHGSTGMGYASIPGVVPHLCSHTTTRHHGADCHGVAAGTPS
jgi:hypothetical protein